MAYYITYGEFQSYMTNYYRRTGNRLQFPELASYLYQNNLLSESPQPNNLPVNTILGNLSDEEFDRAVDSMNMTLTPNLRMSTLVEENDIIPTERDVFIFRHPRYTRLHLHKHNYFEITLVVSGTCNFYFEKETRTMVEGEVCMIAPGSVHDISIDDDSLVICIMIRKSTFNTAFFSLLSQQNLLAQFFRTTLLGDIRPNYLLFFAKDTGWIKNIAYNALGECNKHDAYSNTSCTHWVNLLFTTLLRSYSQTLQFYNYQMGADFSLMLQYIQHNYQTLTLASLAEFFHYSEPYLCTLIKQNTGYSFTNLIKQLRMADAVKYLINTNLKVSEIAEHIGYNSSDHFSRVFRQTYGMSPQKYKSIHVSSSETFVPVI